MKPNISIALGAGLISAVVFASSTTGPIFMRLLLLAVLALPISLAGFSYNAAPALLAALAGTALLSLIVTPFAVLVFALAVFPVAGLVYLSLLARETETGEPEWYPAGRILLAAQLISATIVAVAFALFAGDMAGLKAGVKTAIEDTIKQGMLGLPNREDITAEQISQVTDLMILLLPAVSATMVLTSLLLALWLGARVALASGTLVRSWPDIAAFTFPAGTPLLLVAAFAATVFLDGKPQLMALAYAGTLYAGYVMLGLAIVHFVTRGAFWRTPVLVGLYVILFLANSGASLLLALIGLADGLYPFRDRANGPTGPKSDLDA